MATEELHNIIERADLSTENKNDLRRIVDFGLSTAEQHQLAEQMRDDPQLLYQLNEVFQKKQQFINDPDKFDEILEEEEKLLQRLT